MQIRATNVCDYTDKETGLCNNTACPQRHRPCPVPNEAKLCRYNEGLLELYHRLEQEERASGSYDDGSQW